MKLYYLVVFFKFIDLDVLVKKFKKYNNINNLEGYGRKFFWFNINFFYFVLIENVFYLEDCIFFIYRVKFLCLKCIFLNDFVDYERVY